MIKIVIREWRCGLKDRNHIVGIACMRAKWPSSKTYFLLERFKQTSKLLNLHETTTGKHPGGTFII